jgi:hypothetical protein
MVPFLICLLVISDAAPAVPTLEITPTRTQAMTVRRI